MISGNKGEWSEIYTLLRIIGDQKLFAGDSDLNRIEHLLFPILKILRDESNGTYAYGYDKDVVLIQGNNEEFRIPIQSFQKQASFLLKKLQEKTSTTFAIPEVENFLNSFQCSSLKASSSIKSDIRIVIHDQRTGSTPELGFSIKSQLGGASTLLNAGKTTNFIFKILGTLTEDEILQINGISSRSKIKDRLKKIHSYSGKLKFVKTESSVFGNNLTLIDSSLPEILAELLYRFYTTSDYKTLDLIQKVANANPLDFDQTTEHPFYSYKFKRFLTDIALGMMPSKVWTGELDATGGYLVVKENGDVLCYHIYNRNEFEDYLLTNTRLETASSTRHGFGSIYSKDGENFINLNLQIRFLK